MKDTTIKWCDHTWSPWHSGPLSINSLMATKNWRDPEKWNQRSFICDRCGLALAQPQGHVGRGRKKCGMVDGDGDLDVTFHRPRVLPSLCDWLDDEVSGSWLARFLDLIQRTPNIDWLLLTKRPDLWLSRMAAAQSVLPEANLVDGLIDRWLSDTPPANVWLGASVEDQTRADKRIPELLKIPARLRFLSVEPLLGPVDLSRWVYDRNAAVRSAMAGRAALNREQAESVIPEPGIHWVIVGGESGPGARPCNISWVRDIVRQCAAAGVPCFVKQLGAVAFEGRFAGKADPASFDRCERLNLRHPKGGDPDEWPEDLRVRQMPEVKT